MPRPRRSAAEGPHCLTADDLIEGYREFADRSRAPGTGVVGATAGPFQGRHAGGPAAGAARQEVGVRIRSGGEPTPSPTDVLDDRWSPTRQPTVSAREIRPSR
ncbi:hypothetical protein ACFYNL_04110 [Streptomyces sp. NPDC007808]|uniref:hypothetical protein n=1 Tax=Streptomyces sp. NPDC007808 TaxID=3364779 RepID=UPI0036C18B2D